MENQVITVSQLSGAIKELLEVTLGVVRVQGELSNYKAHSSGHRYFTLKDEGAQISCTLWRGKPLSFQPADGMKVIVTGIVTVYPPRGNYQIDCQSITPAGMGDLYLAYEALKKKLSEAGYFDEERKRYLPELPMAVGVSTSPTGAAIKDILITLNRRFPMCEVYFRPTLVQGDGAAEDIAKAIAELNDTPSELLIVGRGGGSLEDLWAYNSEIVANAIFNSKLPVISAVGHETDFTIADFVADMRAATPTAAAELATPQTLSDFNYFLTNAAESMKKDMLDSISKNKDLLDYVTGRDAERRLIDKINRFNQTVDDFETRITQTIKYSVDRNKFKLDSLESGLKPLHPLAPMQRGFALLKGNGEIISNKRSLSEFKQIEIIREEESAEARISKVKPKPMFIG